MIFFFLLYIFLSFLISFAISKLVKNKLLKILWFSNSFAILSGFWFIEPGSNSFAPIVSIAFLETTIIDSNGFARLFRPLAAFIVLTISAVLMFYLLKQYFFKKK